MPSSLSAASLSMAAFILGSFGGGGGSGLSFFTLNAAAKDVLKAGSIAAAGKLLAAPLFAILHWFFSIFLPDLVA